MASVRKRKEPTSVTAEQTTKKKRTKGGRLIPKSWEKFNSENRQSLNSWVTFSPGFLSKSQKEALFNELETLRKEGKFQPEIIKMGNLELTAPRLTLAMKVVNAGVSAYRYAGKTMVAVDATPQVQKVFELVNQDNKDNLQGNLHPFIYVLINLYRDRKDSIGWHADNEKGLVDKASIYSVSVGAPRCFQLRRKKGGPDKQWTKEVYECELTSGSLFVMGGETQKHFKHRVPTQKLETGVRYNLTFRCLNESK